MPKLTDQSSIVSWLHFGDLHMTTRQEQNYRDFTSLIEEVNQVMADSLNFAFLPGDNADHGSIEEYQLVREGLDGLQLPWFAIVGDHDVHLNSHDNFLSFMMPKSFYRFEVGSYRFLALDAFASQDPKQFDISSEQLNWLRQELELADAIQKRTVLFLHCYPSELGKFSSSLRDLIKTHCILLVDMGHTHYNEIANDRRTLYTATRSTGQIEEGPVGFSITNLDNGVVSWRFRQLGEWPLVMITSPADEKLVTQCDRLFHVADRKKMTVRVKAWSDRGLRAGYVTLGDQKVDLEQLADSAVWQANLDTERLPKGSFPLTAYFTDEVGKSGQDLSHVFANSRRRRPKVRFGLDRDNVIAAWPVHGILGTQLGPNKNGRKW